MTINEGLCRERVNRLGREPFADWNFSQKRWPDFAP